MKVRTLKRFSDLKESKVREIGEEFIVSQERYQEILSKGSFVETVKEEVSESATRKRKTRAKSK